MSNPFVTRHTCGEWLFECGAWHFPKDFNFIDDYEKEINTREIGKHDFLFSLFSGIPEYYLGDFTLPDNDKLKALIDVFELIDLDLSLFDSNSGESDRVNFTMGSDLKIKYKFER